MDYVTRQFINLTKKLRDDLRNGLKNILRELKQERETTRNYRKTQDAKPIPQLTLTSLPYGVQVHKSPADKREEEKYQNKNLRVQRTTLIVLAFYAGVVALQWVEMTKASDLAEKANRDAWILADRANQVAIESERPWIGISMGVKDWEVPKSPVAIVYFINSGRRPAKVTHVCFDKGDFRVFPKNPPCTGRSTDVQSVALIVPGGNLSNTQPEEQFTQTRSDFLARRTRTFFIYANVDYEDVLTHAKHWTHACWQYFPGFKNEAAGFVNCPIYNEVDPEKPQERP